MAFCKMVIVPPCWLFPWETVGLFLAPLEGASLFLLILLISCIISLSLSSYLSLPASLDCRCGDPADDDRQSCIGQPWNGQTNEPTYAVVPPPTLLLPLSPFRPRRRCFMSEHLRLPASMCSCLCRYSYPRADRSSRENAIENGRICSSGRSGGGNRYRTTLAAITAVRIV